MLLTWTSYGRHEYRHLRNSSYSSAKLSKEKETRLSTRRPQGVSVAEAVRAATRLASLRRFGYEETNFHLGVLPMIIPLSTSIIAGISLSPLISLIAGIIILIVPRLLNFIVAIYLIIIGLVGLLNL
jgi:DUF3096 family protein